MVGNGGNRANGKEAFLPHDVLINILKSVSVKSLIRFKCVSKDWTKLLETLYFIAQHLHHSSHNNPSLLLKRSPVPWCWSPSYCVIGPDFNTHDVNFLSLSPTDTTVIASCNGLLCIQHPDKALSLFNPATRKIKYLPQTPIGNDTPCHVGFGFSPLLSDYNVVRISVFDRDRVNQAEVFSLTTGSWTEIDAVNLRTVCIVSDSVTANGAIFWRATMTSDPDTELVLSFDIGLQVFTLLRGPPPSPARSYEYELAIYNDKLAMFRYSYDVRHKIVVSRSMELWVLEGTHTCAASAGESWIKMYSVRPRANILPLSIWRDEIVCKLIFRRYGVGRTVLFLFNPYTNQLKEISDYRDEFYHFSCNYVESLVPVDNDQPHW